MAIFKKSGELKAEEMISRLCAKCVISGADLVECRKEIGGVAQKAIDEYIEAAMQYRAGIKGEIDKRIERWDALEKQRQDLLDKVKEAEARLGAAMVSGDDKAANTAEDEIAGLHDEIRKIEDRQRIFKSATFSLSGAGGIKAVEAKEQKMLDVIQMCDKVMDAVNETAQAHLDEYRDNIGLFSTGKPATVAGAHYGLVNINFPPEIQMDTLRLMASDDLTIEDILQM